MRRKPKLVVNIEISKDGDLWKRIQRQNVFHFGSKVVKEFTVVSEVMEEVNSTDVLSLK